MIVVFSSNVSGHIIGKGGETIAELRRSSCTNIMMSKANELFPGTQVKEQCTGYGPAGLPSGACFRKRSDGIGKYISWLYSADDKILIDHCPLSMK